MKYDALASFFASQRQARLRLTFDEVARHANTQLPRSAYEHPAWWANHGGRHVQAKAWLDAGYKTENVDLKAQVVEFVRAEAPGRGVREMQKKYEHQPGPPYKVHPAYGALKGTFTVDPNWDLTNPVFDEDEMAEWEASLERKARLIEEGLRQKK
jgi:hypothetical protein